MHLLHLLMVLTSEVHCLLSFPSSPTSNLVYKDVAMADMTENPSYVTAKEVVTSFTSATEEEEGDHRYAVLPSEVNEKSQRDTKHVNDQENAADDLPMYTNLQ